METTKWIIRAKNKILVKKTTEGMQLPWLVPSADFKPKTSIQTNQVDHILIGESTLPLIMVHSLDAIGSIMVAIAPDTISFSDERFVWISQRAAFVDASLQPSLTQEHHALLKALGTIEWLDSHQFCGRCGQKNVLDSMELAFHCKACEVFYYPKMSPSILVRITRGNEILLARSSHFKPGMYSNIAGFIELGETAEECLHREVFEEVGLRVHNIQYFGSQYWPFPNSFMLAYTAEYLSGDLKICPKEIEDAKWFSLDNLPILPTKLSISGQLIADFIPAE